MRKFKLQIRKDRRAKFVVQVRDHSGRIVTRSFERAADAKEFYAEKVRERRLVREGLQKPQSKILFFDWAAEWLEGRVKAHPESTHRGENDKLRRVWLPKFGNEPLPAIKSEDLKKELESLTMGKGEKVRPISNATRNRHRSLLHNIFESARKNKLITHNPVSEFPAYSEKKKTRPTRYWKTIEESDQYIAAAYGIGELYGMWAVLMNLQGPRPGEALALKFGDIDFSGKVIVVQRTVEAITGKVFDRTKGQGAGGRYVVPLFPRTEEALLRWRAVSAFTESSNFVLTNPKTGRHFAHWDMYDFHKSIVAAAGVLDIEPHKIRHSYATRLDKAGFSARERQLLLGHETAQATAIYTHADAVEVGKKAVSLGFGKGAKDA